LTYRNTQGNSAGNDRNPARDRPHQHNRRNWDTGGRELDDDEDRQPTKTES